MPEPAVPLIAILLLLLVPVLALLLWPLGLWQRYRHGTRRQRLWPWLLGLRAALLVPATAIYLLGAGWLASRHGSAGGLATGFGAGAALGLLAALLTRLERVDGAWWQTANRWVLLAVLLLVAARAAWLLYDALVNGVHAHRTTGLLAGLGALVAGYALAQGWGLLLRLRACRKTDCQPRGTRRT